MKMDRATWIAVGVIGLFAIGSGLFDGDDDEADSSASKAPPPPARQAADRKPTKPAAPKITITPVAKEKKRQPAKRERPKKPAVDPRLDDATRAYIARVQGCQLAVGLVIAGLDEVEDDFALAANTTQARDVCEEARDWLLTADDKGFRDEAALAWTGVDRLKSGLNAMLAFIDNPRPSKLVEARDKLQAGDQQASEGLRQINRIRRSNGLKAVKR